MSGTAKTASLEFKGRRQRKLKRSKISWSYPMTLRSQIWSSAKIAK
jgi:hypothetical protein